MIQFPDFFEFRKAIEALGLPILAAEIKRALESGAMDVDFDNLIFGESGIHSLTEKDGNLFLTKVILHIADWDWDIQRLNKVGLETARADFYAGRLDSAALVKAVHKYHFFFCKALKDMFDKGYNHRYKQSHRQDGKFAYKFMEGQTVLHDRKDQMLYPCGYCMNMFRNATDSQVPADEFSPSMFFAQIPQLQWLPDCGYGLDTHHMPDNYPDNFREISQKVRRKRNYRCESCGIDLSARDLQRYADCHHANADRADNRLVNLKCLCVKCHAEQFQHSHMKQSQRYLDFLPIWKEKMRDA